MKSISTAELAVLVQELSEFTGFYIDRFYEVGDDRFRLKLSKNKVQPNINIILSHTINKTNYIEKQDMASNFTMAVRKRIEGFVINKIELLNNDRIVLFSLKKGEVEFNLIVEMFGQGNFIITDNNMRILLTYKVHDFKDRSVRPNAEYKPPQQSSEYKIERAEKIEPVIYRDDAGKAFDYSIKPDEKHKGMTMQKFRTLQEALDEFYYENPVGGGPEMDPERKKLVEELQNSIKKQEKILKSIEVEIEGNKTAGKRIFENMNLVNEIIKAAQANKRVTKEELQRQFPKIKVLNVDLKDKKITIELNSD